jgi:multiple sugar transport system permease protein
MARSSAIVGQAVLVTIVALLMLYPLVWMMLGAFKQVPELFKVPPTLFPELFTLDNVIAMSNKIGALAREYMNSLLVAGGITLAQGVTCSTAGFVFAKVGFRGQNAVFVLLMTALMVPVQMTIIPNFVTMRELGLIDSLVSLILLSSFSAFGIFLFRQFFLTVPRELHDAALVDGCSVFGSFWRIHLPLAIPVLAINSILAFNAAWGDFFTPLILLKSLNNMTLPLGITLITGPGGGEPSQAVVIATLDAAIIPVIIVFLVLRRQLIKGITTTGLGG